MLLRRSVISKQYRKPVVVVVSVLFLMAGHFLWNSGRFYLWCGDAYRYLWHQSPTTSKAGQGSIRKAIDFYSEAIRLNPNFFDAYLRRATVYKELGSYDKASALGLNQKAIEDSTMAIRLRTDSADAYFSRADGYWRVGDYDKVIDDDSKVISLHPKDLDFFYSHRGNAYDYLGQHQNAIDDYSKAIGLDPKQPLSYSSRGESYLQLGQFQYAIDDFGKAISLGNGRMATGSFYEERGAAYAKLGRYQEAIHDLSEAISEEPVQPAPALLCA